MQITTKRVLLIINCGSSSLKFAIYRLTNLQQPLFRGQIKAIGGNSQFQVCDGDQQILHAQSITISDHRQAMQVLLEWKSREVGSLEIAAVGHRVVHGGTRFYEPALINAEVINYLQSLIPLAPNHQPASLLGITELLRLQPELTQVACFDTAFHHCRLDVEQHFALPSHPELALVRRYGFHGLSYEYIASVLPDHLGENAEGKVVVAHLGHGASLCAIQQRRSVATTMSFTPLDGIPMATRSGSIDPAVVLYLLKQGMTPSQVADLLYFQSGLLGVSGVSDDMAVLLKNKTPQTERAIEQFVHHSVRAIGSLAAALEGLDALVFTAGIGEHAVPIREAICKRCKWLGLELDSAANARGQACISKAGSPVQAWIIPTDEEQMIAMQTLGVIKTDNIQPRGSL